MTFVLPFGTTQAHNNYFLPGDAFFSVCITRDGIAEWMTNKEDSFTFSYARYDGKFMACGNIGYHALKVTGLDDNWKAALSEAYWRYARNVQPVYRVENDDPLEVTQTNGVVALIYNKDFDEMLGLKYNEHWQKQGEGVYGGLMEAADAVVWDWNGGPKVPALKVDQKLDPLAHLKVNGGDVHRVMDTVLTIPAKNIKIALVGFTKQNGYAVMQTCPNLQKIADIYSGDHDGYMWIDGKGFTEVQMDPNKGEQKSRVQIPLKDSQSWIPAKPPKPFKPEGTK